MDPSLFIKIPTDISSPSISTTSIDKDYVKVYSLTIEATPLKINTLLPDRTGNFSLNATYFQQNILNGTRNLHNKMYKLHHIFWMKKWLKQKQRQHNKVFHPFILILQLQNQKIRRYSKQLYNPQ